MLRPVLRYAFLAIPLALSANADPPDEPRHAVYVTQDGREVPRRVKVVDLAELRAADADGFDVAPPGGVALTPAPTTDPMAAEQYIWPPIADWNAPYPRPLYWGIPQQPRFFTRDLARDLLQDGAVAPFVTPWGGLAGGWAAAPYALPNPLLPILLSPDANRRQLFNERDMERRKLRLLSNHQMAVDRGVELLRAGEWQRALVAFTLASQLDQGDPACRVHLMQARLALGHYRDAARMLYRALDLQPNLVYIDLHLAAHYPAPEIFYAHIDNLVNWNIGNLPDPEIDLLIGYLEFQRGNFARAHRCFRRADYAAPGNAVVQAFLDISRPAAMAAR